MLRLAVATQSETYQRMREPLEARDVAVTPVTPSGRTFGLDQPLAEVDVGFVFPPRLMEGGVVDALLDVPWVNDREAVLRSRNKGAATARLRAAGLPVPDTVVVSNPADREDLVAAYRAVAGGGAGADPTPVVVKPNSTTRGVGVARATDLDSFLGICDYLDLVHDYRATGDRSFLVQEFVPDATDYRAMVVDGAYVGAVERRLPEEARAQGRWKHNVHRGATARAVDLEEDLRELAEATAATLGIPWLGVDILSTEGRAVVSETNARPTIDDAEKYDAGFWDEVAALVRKRALQD